MLYELSTPFLNIHWFMDKVNMTGSKAQVLNGVLLTSTFFSARLAYGGYMSIFLYSDVWKALQTKRTYALEARSNPHLESEMLRFAGNRSLPIWLVLIYLGGHIVLTSLNVFWFGRMIKALQKRRAIGHGKQSME